ncbi:MAG: YkvA family protein [Candidatus Hydrothermarchaeales archaeon]
MSTEKDPALFRGFHEILEEGVRNYEGEFHEIINLTPDMFRLFTNLLEDPLVPASSKPIINATIAYFAAPFDALPEEVYGPVGYLDDLFLCV